MSDAGVWTVLIPAITGLVGAGIGGFATYLSVRNQLHHSAREAQREREHTLKRQVYLEVAEGAARGVEYLAGFANLEVPMSQLGGVTRGNPGWLYRAHAVGSLETIKALDAATECLFSCALDLLRLRVELESVRSEADAIKAEIARLTADAEHLSTSLESASRQELPEARQLIQGLIEDLKSVNESLATANASHSRALLRQSRQQQRLLLESMKAVAVFEEQLAQANTHLRRELKLPLDEKDYLTAVRARGAKLQAKLKEALDSFQIGQESGGREP